MRPGCSGRASADVEVLLGVVAVVAEVEDLVVGQGADSPIGVVVVENMDPQGGAASTGVAEVELDGVGVVGDGTCSAWSPSSRIATRKPWGLKTRGRSRAAGRGRTCRWARQPRRHPLRWPFVRRSRLVDWAVGMGDGVAARSRSNSTPDRAMKVIAP